MRTRLLVVAAALAFTSSAAQAQSDKPCGWVGTRTMTKLAICIDSLRTQVLALDSILDAMGGGAEANTSSNVGAGAQLAKPKVGVDLPFRTITAGTNITVTQNTNDVQIAAASGAGEANTTSNEGGGQGLALTKVGINLPFKTLTAGSNITLTPGASTLEIAAVGGVAGEVNTSSNVGAGVQLAKAKVGVDLPFRTLTAGGNVTLTQNTNDIQIAASTGVPSTGGTFSGDVGFGGVSPSFAVHLEKSLAATSIAKFRNTSATGLGVQFQNGFDTTYALNVLSAAGTGIFKVFGQRVAHLGSNSAFQTKILSSGQTIFGISADDAVTGGDAGVYFTSDNPKVTHAIYAGGGDSGFRILYNHELPDKGGSGGTYSVTTLGQQRLDMEQDGVTSISYHKPFDTAPGSWDVVAGKSILLNAKGRTGGATRDEYAAIASGHVGRGLELGVVPAGGTANITEVVIRMKGSDGAAGALATNPLYLYVNGALRNVQMCDIGGVKTLCYP